MATRIKNLDTLEKEIYRLRLDAKNQEARLEEHLNHFQKNYGSMTMNSIFNRSSSNQEKVKEKIFGALWENEKLRSGIDKIVSHLAERATEGIGDLLDKILPRKK